MKGLIRNNFYSVGSALKWTIAFCILVNVAMTILIKHFISNDTFLSILILGQIGAFVGLTGTALQKDSTSNWSKYEKTLPVKIRDIIMARYISFLIFSIIGILLATLTVVLFSMISSKAINLERIGYGFSFGVAFALLVPAILYPLVLKFGADKSEIMLAISVAITLCLFNGGYALLSPYLINLNNSNMIYRLGWIFISAILFICSYFISIAIYKQKEF